MMRGLLVLLQSGALNTQEEGLRPYTKELIGTSVSHQKFRVKTTGAPTNLQLLICVSTLR